MRVNGNVTGIKDSYLERLDGLYDINVSIEELISSEILDVMAEVTSAINKEISVFINRRGKVVDVSIGDFATVSLPIISFRRGNRRLSGVRCIHTHPGGNGNLSEVDISALINLRLDCIAAAGIEGSKVTNVYTGYLYPVEGALTEKYNILGPYDLNTILSINILNVIKEIEKHIIADTASVTEDERKERVLLIGLNTPDGMGSDEDLLDELSELAEASGAEVAGKILQKRSKVDTAYYIGSGKAMEVSLVTQSYDIDTVIFDDELSGAQVRNLEETIGAKVIDRTTLILDIFASRALTMEGKLQVELAQLKYRLPRLIGLGKVLSRTGGGIGTRGPGEKKLEVDRRHIRERINELEKGLNEVKKNREIQRAKRMSNSIPIVSLIGYTNSGKSTLRNRLAHDFQTDSQVKKEDVLEADMLFATLDPTTRSIKLPNGREILVSDTVGFIRKLPHDLVDAFRATLEEVAYSDLLIHVVDASAPNAHEQIKAVNNVLGQLNALDKPTILALNKVDKIEFADGLNLLYENHENVAEISALYGTGIEDLISMIEQRLYDKLKKVEIRLPYDKMGLKSYLYKECTVLSEEYDEIAAVITVETDEATIEKYRDYIAFE
ncbi:GTPase HflX [Oxobacter pfennigii]|uniref:GTPase HflX n=1 Tax=Oxobacter pfennigii TaxID=36849 RepID=A0A0P8W8V7_9CLOT|nr:GTPase HflX [Oxobacter pfennigii]KPU45103.1 GTPase HflX [Oxobacter pfennigii]